VLGWKSPNYVYANAVNQKLRLLLRNYKIPSSFISLLKG
jgi:alpha-amylase